MSKKIGFILAVMVISCITCKSSPKEMITPAIYQGEKDMAWAIAHYVVYPIEEMEFNRAGKIKVTIHIDEKGKVNEVEAVADDSIEAAEVAIGRKKLSEKEILPINFSVIQSLIKSVEKLNFEPANKNGKPVSSQIKTSVEFILI